LSSGLDLEFTPTVKTLIRLRVIRQEVAEAVLSSAE